MPLTALRIPPRRVLFVAAGTIFALGVVAGATMRPLLPAAKWAPVAPAYASASAGQLPADLPIAKRLDPGLLYPAELVRIIDGDTFEARVRVWPGLDVDTHVRLRGIDAAELHARCADELAKAQAARAALQAILDQGDVTVTRVGIDKYGGRIDAVVATRGTADVSAAMLAGGFARAYNGRKRGSWCG
ncbi:MAG: thermonuclease family protein [Xanthobacteraceae bacterium]